MAAISESNVALVVNAIRLKGEGAYKRMDLSMRRTAKMIYDRSQELVPVDTDPHAPHSGQLKRSGRIERKQVGRKITYDVMYGGPGIRYAVFVHEDERKAHGATFNVKYAYDIFMGVRNPRRPQESAKFLTIPASNLSKARATFRKEIKS